MRKKKHPEHVNHERWLVSYADFITLLFAFFTTLYAISTVDQKKAGKLQYSMLTALNIDFFPTEAASSGVAVVDPVMRPPSAGSSDAQAKQAKRREQSEIQLRALEAELDKLAAGAELKGRLEVTRTSRGLVVSLTEAGFFGSGRADLGAGALSVLDIIIARVSIVDGLETMIEGHTDNVPIHGSGSYKTNWELSTARATSVIAYLLNKHGLDPTTVSAAGYAEFRPIASNDTADGRARNRRVDIVIRPRPTELEPTPIADHPQAEILPATTRGNYHGPT